MYRSLIEERIAPRKLPCISQHKLVNCTQHVVRPLHDRRSIISSNFYVGSEAEISSKATLSLAMMVNELATNARK